VPEPRRPSRAEAETARINGSRAVTVGYDRNPSV